MASRSGARAAGSDGSDFRHREKVATHYQVSSVYKTRMKFAILLHFLLFFFLFAKVAAEVAEVIGFSLSEKYDISFPKPLLWEWIWLSSPIFALLSHVGLQKNKVTMMKISAWGIFIFGVFPIVGAAIYYLEDLMAYMQSNSTKQIETFKGIPIAAIWYGFIGIAFQVHMLSVVFALKLIEAWSPKHSKKST